MRPTVFQRAELRDENDNIIQQGTYGKGSALSNSTNDGWVDYVMNNLEALRSMSVGATIPVETLPESGETGKAYVVTTGTDAGKLFMWDGEDWVEITGSIGDYLPITGGTITGNLAVVGISTAVTPNADDNSTKVATTEYVQTEIKPIETDVDIADKRITNIEKLLQGNLYDYQTDSTSAYTKTVPNGAMPYAGLEKVGGKTIVFNQLYGTYTAGFDGLSRVSDGVYHLNGTLNTVGYCLFGNTNMYLGHKYYCAIKGYASTQNQRISVFVANGGIDVTSTSVNSFNSAIQTCTRDWYLYIRFDVGTYNDVTITCKCIDLTLMFGAENEPTKEQFESMFPADTYPFSTGTLLSAGVTEVVSKDSNNTTLQTIPIPTAIRNLEGYGWSAGSVYNYIDFERKKFVKRVARVDLGSFSWVKTVDGNDNRFYSAEFLNTYKTTPVAVVGNFICSKYVSQPINYVTSHSDSSIGIYTNKAINIKDNAYDDATAFKSAMSGVYLYYELATQVETDISEYLTDDNLINVESGGALTFPNSNGTDYQIHVPSEETYMIDLQASL